MARNYVMALLFGLSLAAPLGAWGRVSSPMAIMNWIYEKSPEQLEAVQKTLEKVEAATPEEQIAVLKKVFGGSVFETESPPQLPLLIKINRVALEIARSQAQQSLKVKGRMKPPSKDFYLLMHGFGPEHPGDLNFNAAQYELLTVHGDAPFKTRVKNALKLAKFGSGNTPELWSLLSSLFYASMIKAQNGGGEEVAALMEDDPREARKLQKSIMAGSFENTFQKLSESEREQLFKLVITELDIYHMFHIIEYSRMGPEDQPVDYFLLITQLSKHLGSSDEIRTWTEKIQADLEGVIADVHARNFVTRLNEIGPGDSAGQAYTENLNRRLLGNLVVIAIENRDHDALKNYRTQFGDRFREVFAEIARKPYAVSDEFAERVESARVSLIVDSSAQAKKGAGSRRRANCTGPIEALVQ